MHLRHRPTTRSLVFCLLAAAWLNLSAPAFTQTPGGAEKPAPQMGLVAPKLVSWEHKYPDAANAEQLADQVRAQLTIDASGQVIGVEVLDAATHPGYGFDELATEAMWKFVFEPATSDGVAIPSRIEFLYEFVPPAEEVPADASGGDVPPVEEPPVEVEPPPLPPISMRGEVLERGTRIALAGVWLAVSKGARTEEAYTDSYGKFEFRGLDPGEWNILIEEPDYGRYESQETVEADGLLEVTYYIERTYYDEYGESAYIYETRERKLRKEVNKRTLEVAEIQRIPGNQGDALKVIQNLPGVARPMFNLGQIIVRGSDPADTVVQLDGAPIPQLYHFLALTSVVNSDILSSIDFYPGNFSARYGRAMGGILDVKTRAPASDRLKGYADIDITDTSLFLEGPITDELSFEVSVRRSYLDAVLLAVIPDDAEIDLLVAPRYYDYQGRLNWKPAPKHELELFSYGSDDALEFLNDAPNGDRDPFSYGTAFHRVQLSYDYQADRFENSLIYNFGTTGTWIQAGPITVNLDSLQHTLRDEIQYEATKALTVRAGADVFIDDFTVSGQVPGFFGGGPGEDGDGPGSGDGGGEGHGPDSGRLEQLELTTLDVSDVYLAPAIFVEAELKPAEPLTVLLGGRVDYDERVGTYSGDWRTSLFYEVGDFVELKGGLGRFSQAPTQQEMSDLFGNPDLGYQHAYHYGLGVGVQMPFYDPLTAELTGFYKDMNNLVVDSTEVIVRDGEAVNEKLNNQGQGRVEGLEVLLKHALGNNFFGWVSYTLSQAERRDADGTWHLFDYDQTHILTLIGSYKLPDGWQVGLRFRYVSGNPYTPETGSVFDVDNNRYSAIIGDVNSARMPAFHQLDARIDKTWIFDWWKLGAYLDVQGVYYHGNPEAIQYNYDSTEKAYVEGLPILPTLGIKGEF